MMLSFELTFMDFLLEHQERHGRTYHFLILMNSILNAAKRIQHYYLTGAAERKSRTGGLR
jgi:fructose-1,6-bisphosphatase I